jgi:translocation and assembly module TamB
MRGLRATIRALGWAVLSLLALTGVALSGLVAYASSSFGRPVVAAKVIRLLDAQVAGHLDLGGLELLPDGTIVVHDFTANDPDGKLVLQVDRLLVSVDLRRLRNRVVGFAVELDGAAVLVNEDLDGHLSLVRAFAPAHPGPERPREARRAPWREPLGGWTLQLRRLEVRDATFWWQDAVGRTRVELQDLSLTARALVGPHRARTEISLRGQALDPVPGPITLDLRATLNEDRLRVPLLRAGVGATNVAGLADVDLDTRIGRAALLRAEIDRAQARQLVKRAPSGADLAFQAYADADGSVATLALKVEPKADAAVAVRLDGARALGFDIVTRELDPAALSAAVPAGKVSLRAHGGLAGAGFASLRGNLDLALDRSTFGGGELGPAAAAVHVEPGSWEAERVSLVAPGVKLDGRLAWKKGGGAAGHLAADVGDLARATANAEKLLRRALPRLSGEAHVEADLSGTAAAPSIAARVSAPTLAVGGTTASGVEARVTASGPFRPGTIGVTARLARVRSGDRVLAQGLSLDGGFSPEAPGSATASLAVAGTVPSLGREPVSLDATGSLASDLATLRLSRLGLVYPGTRYELVEPATIAFTGPRVDKLTLASGLRRITIEGGIAPQKAGARGSSALDARVELLQLDLAHLPVGILPADQGIAGEVSAEARATGTLARPVVDVRFAVEGAGFRSEHDLSLGGVLRWDGAARRASARLDAKRAQGGTVELTADLPVPMAGRPGEAVSGSLRVNGVSIPAILALVRSEAPVRGKLDVQAAWTGTVGAPLLSAQVAVPDGGVRDLDAVGLAVNVSLNGGARATADVKLAGQPAAHVEARAPLAAAALLADPGRAVKALLEQRSTADATFPGVDLAALSGRLGVPAGLRGRLDGEAHLAGRPGAPRGTATFTIMDGAWGSRTDVGGTVAAEARDDRVEARVSATTSGVPALALTVRLGAPLETIASRAGLEAAPLRLDGTVPRLDLEHARGSLGVELAGVLEAKLHAEGTVARPTISLDASGSQVRISDRPLGAVRIAARAGGERTTADVALDLPSGGKLAATAAVTAPVSLALSGATLRTAPAEVKFRAEAVDLSFLPALAPGTVRSAAGRLDADLSAAGPLAELAPRGTLRLSGGRVGLLDYGDWNDVGLDGAITADAVELRNFHARRGEGTITLRAALRGLGGPAAAQLDGRIDASKLTVSRNGTDLATVTLGVKLSGTYRDRKLDARLDMPGGEVRLADKLPRDLQPLERRQDITVGPKPPPRPQPTEATPATSTPTAGGPPPFILAARLVVPGKLLVRREVPRIALELKSDVTYEHQRAGDFMSGTVEVVRGSVEPLSDRRFDVKRGRVTFTGGPPKAAIVDVEAEYVNPAATVTVTASGPLTKPEISLKSNPPLGDQDIAMLIATGQVENRAGSAAAATAGAGQNEVRQNAAQKLGFAVFNTFIRNQLPLPTGDVSLDTTAARVGGYIPGTPVFVGYTRRFDANRSLGENEDEVRMEYAINSHWTLEGRWGNANSGAATLMWSKDY